MKFSWSPNAWQAVNWPNSKDLFLFLVSFNQSLMAINGIRKINVKNRHLLQNDHCRALRCIACRRDKYLFLWDDVRAPICWKCSQSWSRSKDTLRKRRFKPNRKKKSYSVPERIELFRRNRKNIRYFMLSMKQRQQDGKMFELGKDIFKTIHQFCKMPPFINP